MVKIHFEKYEKFEKIQNFEIAKQINKSIVNNSNQNSNEILMNP